MRCSLVLLALIGCSQVDVASTSQAVVGGYFDESKGPTVAIFRCSGTCAFTPYLNVDEICSGTLIGPNLILTARHCVAPQANADQGVLCSKTTFGTPFPADNFIATPAKDVLEGGPWYIAREVDVAGVDGDLVCGNDLAVLHLRDSYVGAAPLVPRILTPPAKNETYSAIGYGDDLDGGIGYRHRRDNLKVACVGSQCKTLGLDLAPAILSSEWEGETGLCGGDSGGPAIDGSDMIIGVTSRANASSCTSPAYSRVDSHAAWLQAQAVIAASAGNYALPEWAYAPLPTDAGAPVDAATPSDATVAPSDATPLTPENPAQAQGGCNASGRAPPSLVGALVLLVLRSARRRSKSSS